MLLRKFRCFSATVVVCAVLFAAGCSNTIALKFTPADSTTYKVAMEYQKSVEWMGQASDKPAAFQGGRTGNNLQITFTQDILSVSDNGDAVARITFKDLKYRKEVRNIVNLDFDSSRPADANNPLNKLIGQSYFIEITTDGQVLNVINTSDAQAAVRGSSPEHLTALNLLNENFIKERHTIPALPQPGQSHISVGQKWRNIKDYSFDMMGDKHYERVYTLEKINEPVLAGFMQLFRDDNRDHKIAVAGMEAYPSAEQAKQEHMEEGTSPISPLFDNIQSYTGELRLDLTAGQVQKYYEKLLTEWVIADPRLSEGGQPAALKMGATRTFSLERID